MSGASGGIIRMNKIKTDTAAFLRVNQKLGGFTRM
jgi:hypothetical protein